METLHIEAGLVTVPLCHWLELEVNKQDAYYTGFASVKATGFVQQY